jgi:membrane complex biogenesis BtpA family protein
MVHLLPLPGAPAAAAPMSAILDAAMQDAVALRDGGCDALLVENMGDLPYLRGEVPHEVTAAMTRVTAEVVRLGLPVGVQVLAAANHAALAVALAAGAHFVRAEAFAYGHLADEGWLDACAGPLLRTRRALGAQHIEVWADVQKKHAAHAATADLSLLDLSKGAAFCGADALIITGASTGQPAAPADAAAAARSGLPVAIGSGITPDNALAFTAHARALIVGTSLKRDGDWRNPVEVGRVRALRAAMPA